MIHIPNSTSPPSLWAAADKISQQIADMRDYARILAMAGAGLVTDEGVAIDTVAFELVEMAERAAELMTELQGRLKTETEAQMSA